MAIAISESLKKPRPIQTAIKEALIPQVQGLGVIILHPDTDQILVVEEQMDKHASRRGCGEISPPMETAKKGLFGIGREKQSATLMGALAEVLDDTSLPLAQNQLIRVQTPHPLHVSLNSAVTAAIEILIYEGDPSSSMFQPTASLETKTPHWMSIADFLQNPKARQWGKAVVHFAKDQGFLDFQTLQQLPTNPVLRNIDSIERSYIRRERKPDVVIPSRS